MVCHSGLTLWLTLYERQFRSQLCELQFSSLLMHLEGSERWYKCLDPVTPGGMHKSPRLLASAWSHPAVVAIWEMVQWMEDLSVFLCQFPFL